MLVYYENLLKLKYFWGTSVFGRIIIGFVRSLPSFLGMQVGSGGGGGSGSFVSLECLRRVN